MCLKTPYYYLVVKNPSDQTTSMSPLGAALEQRLQMPFGNVMVKSSLYIILIITVF